MNCSNHVMFYLFPYSKFLKSAPSSQELASAVLHNFQRPEFLILRRSNDMTWPQLTTDLWCCCSECVRNMPLQRESVSDSSNMVTTCTEEERYEIWLKINVVASDPALSLNYDGIPAFTYKAFAYPQKSSGYGYMAYGVRIQFVTFVIRKASDVCRDVRCVICVLSPVRLHSCRDRNPADVFRNGKF